MQKIGYLYVDARYLYMEGIRLEEWLRLSRAGGSHVQPRPPVSLTPLAVPCTQAGPANGPGPVHGSVQVPVTRWTHGHHGKTPPPLISLGPFGLSPTRICLSRSLTLSRSRSSSRSFRRARSCSRRARSRFDFELVSHDAGESGLGPDAASEGLASARGPPRIS